MNLLPRSMNDTHYISFPRLEEVMISAALDASHDIMRLRSRNDFIVHIKSDHSPVTCVDQKAHDIICFHLKDAFPGIPVISEEDKTFPNIQARQSSFFLVDPLDGTRCFIEGSDDFSVNIAYLENNIPVAGVIAVPAKQKIFYAAKDHGTIQLNFDWKGKVIANGEKKIQCVKPLDKDQLIVLGSPFSRSFDLERFTQKISSYKVYFVGSAYKFCLIASGIADLYPRFGATYEWDTAAGQIIVEEAGGAVYQMHKKTPLIYNKPDFKNDHFIVCNQERGWF